MTDLPAVVIKSAGKDFSVYLPDRNPDENVRALQQEFISYNLGIFYIQLSFKILHGCFQTCI